MATITSTIKLVDQMTPTLNKISKAIDRVNTQANRLGSTKTWSGFNNGIQTASKSTHNLYNTLRRTVLLLGALRGLQGLVTVSDTMMNATARLGNLTKTAGETARYMDAIYAASQRSRGNFMEMVNSVGKLGTVAGHAFDNVEEMIAFTELMNKLFVISGASAAESSNAMYQLTQAMAAGRLQGDEMRSILENAPMLAQRIADYMGVSIGEVKQLGAEGVITADIIKAALFGAADDIEERYSKMPKTIGQIWTQIKNHALNAFRPVIDRIQKFINSPMFQKFQNMIYNIITAIANKIILLFDLLETPRVQKAIQAICNAFAVLWDVVSWVGQLVVDVAVWIGDIVHGVIAALLMYKAVTLAVSAAAVVANIAQGISAWVAGLMAGQAWAWVILIIIALIAVIYLGVAAWNHFTGQSVSATGVLLGCIAFVISGVISLFVFLWDVFMSIVHFIVYLGKVVWQVFVDIGKSIVAILYNAVLFVVYCVVAAVGLFFMLCGKIWDSFTWLLGCIGTWGANVWAGIKQLCSNLVAEWNIFKFNTVARFWEIVIGAGSAWNAMLTGASDLCRKMIQPFENFANGVIDLLNSIIDGWNSLTDKMSFTIPSVSIMGKKLWDEKEVKILGSHVDKIGEASWNDWADPTGVNLGGAYVNLFNAKANGLSAEASKQDVNWHTNAMPEYTTDWSDWGGIGELWGSMPWESVGSIWEMDNYSSLWGDLKNSLDGTWDSSQYSNPVEAFKTWYKRGEAFENGVGDVVDGIGALISGLFGGNSDVGSSMQSGASSIANKVGNALVPKSMEDLLGGSGSPTDLLGAIADNTGKGAGSAANIDDTLDMAEDELELLRKIAEKEVVNRFTTAEIKVNMTNNNNVNSKMDLDGIVTHLSTKLYEELGVVASGVHY